MLNSIFSSHYKDLESPNFNFEKFKEEIHKEILKHEKLIEDLKNHHINTYKHSLMVAMYTEYIARHIGGFTEETIRDLRLAALLHDVGKLYIHTMILDLGGKQDLENIAKEIQPDLKSENLMKSLTVWDVLRYKAKKKDKLWISYMKEYLKWMDKYNKKSKDFLNLTLREYLEYHQKATEIILKENKLDKKIIKLAASHHPSYFLSEKDKIPKEVAIIEVADKFNALIQSEGIRNYIKKRNEIEALAIIAEEFKKDFYNKEFKEYEKKSITLLLEIYLKEEIKNKEFIEKSKKFYKNWIAGKIFSEKEIEEMEKIFSTLLVIMILSDEFDNTILYDYKENLTFITKNLYIILSDILKVDLKSTLEIVSKKTGIKYFLNIFFENSNSFIKKLFSNENKEKEKDELKLEYSR